MDANDLDLAGITKFLMANPCYRIEARFTGRGEFAQRDGASFLVGAYKTHSGLYRPGTSMKNLGSGLAVISKTVENFTWETLEARIPVIECAKIDAQQLPLNEVFPNLAQTLRNNSRLLLYAKREEGKILSALSTYYNPNHTNSGSGPRHIVYFEEDKFRPDQLDTLRFSDNNIETFLTGIEAEVMLRIRRKRTEPE